jgi:hypothetical protein
MLRPGEQTGPLPNHRRRRRRRAAQGRQPEGRHLRRCHPIRGYSGRADQARQWRRPALMLNRPSRYRPADGARPAFVQSVVIAGAPIAIRIVAAGVAWGVAVIAMPATVSAGARDLRASRIAAPAVSAKRRDRAIAEIVDHARGAIAFRTTVGVDGTVAFRHARVGIQVRRRRSASAGHLARTVRITVARVVRAATHAGYGAAADATTILPCRAVRVLPAPGRQAVASIRRAPLQAGQSRPALLRTKSAHRAMLLGSAPRPYVGAARVRRPAPPQRAIRASRLELTVVARQRKR